MLYSKVFARGIKITPHGCNLKGNINVFSDTKLGARDVA
jgi:hypothetical protein